MLKRLFLAQSDDHPQALPTYRLTIIGLVLMIVILELFDDGHLTAASQASILFGVGVWLPGFVSVWVIPVVWGLMVVSVISENHGLVAEKEMGLSIVVVLSFVVRRFLLGLEWRLAAQRVLSSLIESHVQVSPQILLERSLNQLRHYARANMVIAVRQVDWGTAKVLACSPAIAFEGNVIPTKIVTEALLQHRFIHYSHYPAHPDATTLLKERGTQSLTVLPLQPRLTEMGLGELRGAILLIWYRRTALTPHLRRFLELLLDGLYNVLRLQDTTRRLDRLQARYSAILETIPEGVAFVDASEEQGWVNQVAAELLHLTPGFVKPMAIAQGMGNLGKEADNETEIAARIAEFGDQEDWSIRDWVWVFSQSRLLALNLSSTPTRVGTVMGRLWIFSDITENYFTQRSLQEQSSKLESRNQALQLTQFSLDRAAIPIFWVGSDAEILYANQAACVALGYSPTELQNLKLYEIDQNFSLNTWSSHWQLIKRCGSLTLESHFLTKGRRYFSVEVTINYLKFDGKEFHCIFAIDMTERQKAQQALKKEKDHSEQLLLNILPQEIADRLREKPGVIADVFEDATVLFADIVGFTEISAWLSSHTLVHMLNTIFSGFDELTQRYGLEKIKTIGDAYMVAGGLPKSRPDHAEAIADMALDMLQVIERFNSEQGESFSIRIGIHTGLVIAGVIGTKKFSYDLWGDTVNLASRMELHGIPGYIQVTEATYQRLCHKYLFKKRGVIKVKGKGEMTTYLLMSRKSI